MSENREIEPLTAAQLEVSKFQAEKWVDSPDIAERNLAANFLKLHATIDTRDAIIAELEAALREIMATRSGGLKDVAKMHTIAQAALDQITNREESA